MAEIFPEIELEEIQELKENAEDKNTKIKSTKISSWGEGTLSTRASKATRSDQILAPTSRYGRINNILASVYK